ncbi:alpha/beta fold hydrolase [Azospirillum picis]|uniref:Sigma-B regulation protein RsbQ n=1 Tax=Azospirillum picis TaxID=488438 RepID=A0ABU0MNF7_9PROT|nr:alpha/beta hydrolase [Azospirillum picis]MBP2301833.1 sigma-B regulation protein RsbQ [Azospirillum picis]MDQ0534992.1 sigma-B regulation protein RsbQ [Azospirillum picis]
MIDTEATLIERHNVTLTGTGDEALVLISGFGTDQSAWRHVVEAFRDRYRIVLFDLPGIGPGSQSHYDHARYHSLDAYAHSVAGLLRALRLGPCICVGHSVAGMVAALASIRTPEMITRLVLLGSSACYRNTGDYHGGFDAVDIDRLIDEATADYIAWTGRYGQMVVSAPANDPSVREFVASLRAMRPDMALSILLNVLNIDVRPRLAEVSVPAVILQTAHDPAVPQAAADHLRDHLKGSVLDMLDAAGHLPHLTAPDLVVGALRRHLR